LFQGLLAGLSLRILVPRGLAAWSLVAQLPLSVGIVDAAAEAQEPLARPLGIGTSGQEQGPLIAQQLRRQAPGAGGGGLVQGHFDQLVAVLQGQAHEQGGRPPQAFGTKFPGPASRQQGRSSLLVLAQHHQVVGEHIQGGAGDRSAIAAQRQG
jgi:hypothetical protein